MPWWWMVSSMVEVSVADEAGVEVESSVEDMILCSRIPDMKIGVGVEV